MDDAPIKAEDIIAPDVFANTIAQAQELLPILLQMNTAFRDMATVTGAKIRSIDPKSITDIQQLENETKKLNDIQKGYNETQKQILVTQEKLRIARKQAKDDAAGELSAYAALNNESKKADQLARNLAAEYGLTNKQFQEAAANARRLKNELSAIDNSIGNYQRNVGNYNNQLGVLARSVRGFGGLGYIITSALGVDPSVFMAIREAGRGIRDLNHIKQEQKIVEGDVALAQNVNTASTEANTVAVTENAIATDTQATAQVTETAATETQTVATTGANLASKAWAATVNILTGSILGLAAVIGLALGALYQLYRINNSLDEQTKDILTDDLKRIDVIKDLVKAADLNAKQQKDTNEQQLKQNELLGKSFKELEDIKKSNLASDVESNKQAIDNQKTLLDKYTKLATDLDKIDLKHVTKEQKKAIIDLYNTTLDNIQDTKDKISELGQNSIDNETKNAEINHDISERALKDALDNATAKVLITKNSLNEEYEAKKIATKKEYDLESFKIGNNKPQQDLALAQYNDKIRELTISHNNELNKIDEAYATAKISTIKNSYDKQIATEKEAIEKRNAILADTTKKLSAKEVDAINLLNETSADKINDLKIDKQLESAKAMADINLSQAKKNSLAEYQAEILDLEAQKAIDLQKAKEAGASGEVIAAINDKYIKLEEQKDNKYFEKQKDNATNKAKAKVINLQTKGASPDKILKAQIDEENALYAEQLKKAQDNNEQTELITAEHLARLHALKVKATEEEIAELKEVSDATFKRLDDSLDYQQKVAQQKLDITDKELQQQLILQSTGQKNTASALLAQQAKEQAAQAALTKQQNHLKEAEQVAQIFLKFLEVYASKGAAAIPLALTSALAGEATAHAISGSAFEGTEDTGGNGSMDEKGGKLWMLHPHEAVIPADMNKKHSGLANAFINDEVDTWMIKNITAPQILIKEKSKSENLEQAKTNLLLKQLTDIMKNKKEFTNVYDTDGKFIGYINKENGIQQMVKSNQYDIIKNKHTFKN